MIQALARKRTSVVALATLLALVAAMFVAYMPARAATGDVSATSGWCLLNTTPTPNVHQLSSDQDSFTAITVEVPDNGDTADGGIDDDDDPDLINIPCSAGSLNQAVTVTPNGSRSPTVTFHEPEVVVSFGAAARAGASIPVRAYVKNHRAAATYQADAAMYAATVTPTTGASIPAPAAAVTVVDTATAAAPAVISNLILLPSASGDYTVTVNISVDDTSPANADGFIAGQATVTVGDDAAVVDTKVATVSLELAMSALDDPLTSLNEGKAEDNTEPANGGDIWLKLTTLNSLDKPASNSDLESLVVFGRGATLTLHRANPTNTAPLQLATPTTADADAIVGNAAGTPNGATHSTAADITHTMFVKVQAIGSNPAAVPVTAYINGVQSNTVDLVFTGSTTAISVTEAAKTLSSKSGELKFTVTGLDKAGNGGTNLMANSVNYRVLDANGDAVSSNPSVDKAQTPTATGGTNPASVTLTVTTSETTAAESGTYTLEVTLGSDTKTAQNVEFNIAGPPANIELTADPMTSSTVGETVQLTATVTDEAGVNVPDGTEVTFASTEGGGAAIISGATAKTVDGVANGLLGVSGGGTTFVYATAGDANATLTFVSTAASPDAMPDVASLSCLDATSGLAVWTCDAQSSASEVFGWLATRGATAIHLYSDSGWVRYSVVDGNEVPGSTDFSVIRNDKIWISN